MSGTKLHYTLDTAAAQYVGNFFRRLPRYQPPQVRPRSCLAA